MADPQALVGDAAAGVVADLGFFVARLRTPEGLGTGGTSKPPPLHVELTTKRPILVGDEKRPRPARADTLGVESQPDPQTIVRRETR